MDYRAEIMRLAGHVSRAVPDAAVEGPFGGEREDQAAYVKVWLTNGYGVHLRTGGNTLGNTVAMAVIMTRNLGSADYGTRAVVALDVAPSCPEFLDAVTVKDVALVLSELGALDKVETVTPVA